MLAARMMAYDDTAVAKAMADRTLTEVNCDG
jgi:hypothetical protein